MALKGLLKTGEVVEIGTPGIAYQLDDAEKDFQQIVDAQKLRFESGDTALVHDVTTPGTPGMAYTAVEGHAVPTSINDTQTPAEKFEAMKADGKVVEGTQVLSSEGIKTQDGDGLKAKSK